MASEPYAAAPVVASPQAAQPRPGAGRTGRTPWARQHPSAVLGAAIVLALVTAALLAPLIAPYDPLQMNVTVRLQPPSTDHPLGTDNYGRDLFTRLVYGARVSLVVGLASVALAVAIGTTIGLASGYLAGWGDMLLMRIVDVVLAFPSLLLALALVSVLGTGVGSVIVAVGLVQWTTYARVVRATALALKQEEFILAARALGVPGARVAVRHILPNALAPLVVLATLGIGGAITTEAALSFLGLGVPPPTPSWGATLAFGLAFLRDSPHLATFPGLAIMLTVLGFNLLGDGLRDITDPRMRRG
jgi:peptide/nickel transport system permease protein